MTVSQDILNQFFFKHLNPSQQVILSRICTALIGIPAIIIALYYSNLIHILWISADIYASSLFVPVIAFFYFRKYCTPLSGILSIGLGLTPVLLNFIFDFKWLMAPNDWPSYPYTTLLGLGLSLIGFLLGMIFTDKSN
jgi:Na+(H+)/acetate symporter ActP